ncbi:MAG: tRNA pseudouridine(55) synthase TruB [Acidimicrobiia bacterium]
MDGLVVVDKPAGMTSHDVVSRLRRIFGQKRIGHAGTLDPGATGVLVVGLGRVTRLLQFLSAMGKSYRGRIVFGVATDTLDAAGKVVERCPIPSLDRARIETATAAFLGAVEQTPPMVSAVKIGGRRLHELHRAGIEVERPSRRVEISRFEVESFSDGEEPFAEVLVDCSSGTYVRVLAADLGLALGGVAHLGALRRLRVGSFTIDEARSLEAIAAAPTESALAPVVAVRDFEQVRMDPELARAVRGGASVPISALPVGAEVGSLVALLDETGALLAIYERGQAGARPVVVLGG